MLDLAHFKEPLTAIGELDKRVYWRTWLVTDWNVGVRHAKALSWIGPLLDQWDWRTATEQIADRAPSGWDAFKGASLDSDLRFVFPGDEPVPPFAVGFTHCAGACNKCRDTGENACELLLMYYDNRNYWLCVYRGRGDYEFAGIDIGA